MKTTISKAAKAYNILKEIKVNEINNETTLTIWKAIIALRPISNDYNKNVEDIRNTLRDKEYEIMQPRFIAIHNKENKAKSGEYTLTDEDIKEANNVNEWFKKWSAKGDKLFNEIANKEIEIKLTKINGQELIKGFKDQNITFEALEPLEWLIE